MNFEFIPFGGADAFWELAHRVDLATRDRSSREQWLTPDERLDELGWRIFRYAVEMDMAPDDAAVLAMDGNLRQRERVAADVRDRAMRHFLRDNPMPEHPEVDPDQRLAYWREQLREPTFVYFIQVGDQGPVKIGRATDPERRIAALQTGSPEDLHLRDVIPGAAPLEAAMHQRFAPARIRGEWFGAEYLPVILVYASGLAESAIQVYEGDGERPYVLGNGARSAQEVLRLRREIERLWLEGHQPDEIARLLAVTADETRDHLAEMRRSTLYDVKRPGGYRGKRAPLQESITRRSA